MSDTATPLARLELTTTSGTIAHLPVWAGIAAADVEPGVTELVDMATAEFAALEESLEPTWAGL
ncbi:MAG: hypothetical protein P8P20_15155, partial [Acidimicrobiales bacterium]|nr:hypothetical protein [Acidimicrobiales bacterium]